MGKPDTRQTSKHDRKQDTWRQNLEDERDGITLYEGLAELEPDGARAEVLRALAEAERRHAAIWASKLGKKPSDELNASIVPSARVRALLWLARRIGTRAVLPLVIQAEGRDAIKYQRQGADAFALAEDERAHQAQLQTLGAGPAAGPRLSIAGRERWHRGGRAGNLRAAVFGMNDGLVSNMSLVLGVAAAGTGHETLVVTGVAGLLAGAFSMAAGEYVSVSSQRDLLRRQIELERRELEEAPEEEAAELTALLARKGLSQEQAASASAEIMKNPQAALDTLVREELGLDPDDLGAPVAAALSSFATFAVGAFIPLVPILLAGVLALGAAGGALASGVLSVTVLAGVGAALGFLSGTSPLRAGLRMCVLGALAAAATIALGRVLGATLAG